MYNIKISNRILKISEYIEDNSFVMDVGCDHCMLSIYIALTKTNMKLLATDINIMPLNIAKSNVNKYKLSSYINLVQSDGLKDIKIYNPDYIVIAGMGGKLIFNIITGVIWTKNKDINFIIQPMSDHYYLRENLLKFGFFISDESVVFDNGKMYIILKINYTGKIVKRDPIYFYFGEFIKKNDENSIKYKTLQYKKVKNIIKGKKMSLKKVCDISFFEDLKNKMQMHLNVGEEDDK